MRKHRPKTVPGPGKPLTPKSQDLSQWRLRQMVLEVVARTPEVRWEKVQDIKNLLETSSYSGNFPRAAINLLRNHLLVAGRGRTARQDLEDGGKALSGAAGIQG